MADLYISVDIEADGPIPGDYSMIQLGASVLEKPHLNFNQKLRPISERYDPKSLKSIGLTRAKCIKNGRDPNTVIREFYQWIRHVSSRNTGVFLAFNAPFDWMFVHWYFFHFIGNSPFDTAGLDIKAYYMSALGLEKWTLTRKREILTVFKSERPHTHDALDDALEQGDLFENLLAFNRMEELVEAREKALKRFPEIKPRR